MKKICSFFLLMILFIINANAQTQKNWYIIGGNLSNLGLNFQEGNTQFSLDLTPKIAWFIRNNFALGAEVTFGLNTARGYTQIDYGVGPIARYYIPAGDIAVPRKTRFFIEANVGLSGQNVKTDGVSTSTNGLGVGFGPGLAYFIIPNIALETMLKYNLNVGFGNSTTNNAVDISLGFQIYLSRTKLNSIKNQIKQ